MLTVKLAQKVRIGVEASNGQILQFYSYIKKIEFFLFLSPKHYNFYTK